MTEPLLLRAGSGSCYTIAFEEHGEAGVPLIPGSASTFVLNRRAAEQPPNLGSALADKEMARSVGAV